MLFRVKIEKYFELSLIFTIFFRWYSFFNYFHFTTWKSNFTRGLFSLCNVELSTDLFLQNSVPLNESALIEYKKQLNSYANIRDYLMSFTTNLVIGSSNSITLQASLLVQLTQATNQLTRSSAVKNFNSHLYKYFHSNKNRSLHLIDVIN